uniref:Uncharacterized protein LOC104230680 n=1 Tax=Nicotiana sylvestris TaxID=4096 RepID=A0A1U7X5U0_NICSY|nr:PREDICTED: uncharacterized protein LOC104230680 [Nicotiana sylvestris]
MLNKGKDVEPVANSATTTTTGTTDVWGPYRTPTHDSKSIEKGLATVENQFRTAVKCLRTDNEVEFKNDQVTSLLQNLGILHQSSFVYTSQQNGAIERRHRSILYMARALRVFESLCYATKVQNVDKFSPRAVPAVHIGYSSSQKVYVIYDLHSKSFFMSKDVLFKKDIFPFKKLKSGFFYLFSILEFIESSPADKVDQQSSSDCIPPATQSPSPSSISDDHSALLPTEVSNEHFSSLAELRRSSRPSKSPVRLTDYVVQPKKSSCQYLVSHYVSCNQHSPNYQDSLVVYSIIVEPSSFNEASANPKWVEAMQAEISSLEENNT